MRKEEKKKEAAINTTKKEISKRESLDELPQAGRMSPRRKERGNLRDFKIWCKTRRAGG